MSELLFPLSGVPDDEAEDVRALLATHGIETYETEAGRWRIGVAAIWLSDPRQAPEARQLLADYQAERTRDAKASWAEQRARGTQPTFLGNLASNPGRVIVVALGGIVILALSVVPFLRFMWPS